MDFTKMSMDELHRWMTGQAIMMLGDGNSMRNITWFIFDTTLRWNQAQKETKKKK
jgi:hypothetical protein